MPQQGQFITPTIRLLRRLPNGVGGMGQVWVAEHLTLRAHVAVKFMAPKFAEHQEFLRRFTREAQSAALLQSPHVAKVFDHATTVDGEPYIVMELLRGETLRLRLERTGPFPVDEACRMIEHAAKALSEAHRVGLVHRDIKPDNLFVLDVEGDPFLKVLDFGIAKDLETDGTTSSGGANWGVAKYMSPERLGVEPRVIDQRADLWALGVVAYELLTGSVPFGGKTDFQVAKAVELGDFVKPTLRRSDLPPLVDAWMARAFARDISDRFDAAMDMADKLHSAIHGRPRISTMAFDARIFVETAPFIESEPIPASQSMRPEVRRSSGIGKLKDSDRARIGSDRPDGQHNDSRVSMRMEPRFPRVPMDLQVDNFEDGVWCAMMADQSPRSVAFDRENASLYMGSWNGDVVGVDTSSRRRLWGTKLAVRVICIATLSEAIALGCSDGRIRLLDATSGKLVQMMAGHEKPVRDVALDEAGKTLVSCSEDNRVCMWRVTTGELSAMLPNELNWVRAIAMVHDGSMIAAGGDDASVRVWDGQLRSIVTVRDASGSGLVRTVAFAPEGNLLAAGFGDGAVRIWETKNWNLVQTLRGDMKQVHSLSFDKSGGHIIAGLASGGIRVWNVSSGILERDVTGRGRPMIALAMNSDGQYLASACNEGRVNIYRWPLDLRLREVPGDRRNTRA